MVIFSVPSIPIIFILSINGLGYTIYDAEILSLILNEIGDPNEILS